MGDISNTQYFRAVQEEKKMEEKRRVVSVPVR